MTVNDLLSSLVRRERAARVLEIGADEERTLCIAEAVPAGGMLIVLEADAGLAARVRQRVMEGGAGPRVSIIRGEPARYLHKVAGPFDLIVHDARIPDAAARFERLIGLLAPAGTLVSHHLADAADYNEKIAGDTRLATTFLPGGEDAAISVRPRSRD